MRIDPRNALCHCTNSFVNASSDTQTQKDSLYTWGSTERFINGTRVVVAAVIETCVKSLAIRMRVSSRAIRLRITGKRKSHRKCFRRHVYSLLIRLLRYLSTVNQIYAANILHPENQTEKVKRLFHKCKSIHKVLCSPQIKTIYIQL